MDADAASPTPAADSPATRRTATTDRASRRQRARQNQNQIRGNAQRDILQRRLERWLFWASVVVAGLQILIVSAVLIATAGAPDGGLPRLFLSFHVIAMSLHVISLFYHRRHPLSTTADGRAVMPETGGTARTMYHVRAASEVLWSANLVLGTVSLFATDANAALYWTAFAVMAWVFVLLLAPVLLVGLFLCCLPCVLAVLPWIVPEPERGTPAAVLRALPVVHYASEQTEYDAGGRPVEIQPEDAACSICIEEYSSDAALRVLPCGHHFHQQCVDQWLRVASTCPLCVRSVANVDSTQGAAVDESPAGSISVNVV